MRSDRRRIVMVMALTGIAAGFASSGASAGSPSVDLEARSPQQQGKKVFVRVTASTTDHLEFLRLTGRIRTGGKTTYFEPNRTGEVKAGTSHTFTLRQNDPDDRRIVRKAMKRGKDLTARIRCDFHPDSGEPIVRKAQVKLVYVAPSD
jgi:hypothetical protein